MARVDVRSEMSRHCSGVVGDHDEAVLLSPEEELGVTHAERKFGLFSHASDLERVGASGVVVARRPEWTA